MAAQAALLVKLAPQLIAHRKTILKVLLVLFLAGYGALVFALITLAAIFGYAHERDTAEEAARNVPEEYVGWLRTAGDTCKTIPASLLAAQIDIESSWNPDLVSDDGEREGLAQFYEAAWLEAATDGDGSGTTGRLEPADSIASLGKAMCEGHERATGYVADGKLAGDELEHALAAWHHSWAQVLRNGGPTGTAVDYVLDVKAAQKDYLWLDENEEESDVSDDGWARPNAGRLTSPYGWRLHPTLGIWRLHAGTDLANGCNKAIWAAGPGKVTAARAAGGYGHYIEIDHGGNVRTRYAHMYASGMLVSQGQSVAAGEKIALTGDDGDSKGCHLHFEVRVSGEPIDPVPFMKKRGITLGAQ